MSSSSWWAMFTRSDGRFLRVRSVLKTVRDSVAADEDAERRRGVARLRLERGIVLCRLSSVEVNCSALVERSSETLALVDGGIVVLGVEVNRSLIIELDEGWVFGPCVWATDRLLLDGRRVIFFQSDPSPMPDASRRRDHFVKEITKIEWYRLFWLLSIRRVWLLDESVRDECVIKLISV